MFLGYLLKCKNIIIGRPFVRGVFGRKKKCSNIGLMLGFHGF
jgi:hypothetical protein